MIDRLTRWPTDCLDYKLTDLITDRPTWWMKNWRIRRLTDQVHKWQTDSMTSLTDWLDDWLNDFPTVSMTDWLNRLLTELLDSWLTDRLLWLSDLLDDWPTDSMIDWVDDLLTDLIVEWLTKSMADRPNQRLYDFLTDSKIKLLIGCLTLRLNDWLT